MDSESLCHFCDPAWEHICREAGFSEREAKIFRMAAHDVKTDVIAHRLGISSRTVREHISRAYERLDIHDRTELLTYLDGIHCEWLVRNGPPPGCRLRRQS